MNNMDMTKSFKLFMDNEQHGYDCKLFESIKYVEVKTLFLGPTYKFCCNEPPAVQAYFFASNPSNSNVKKFGYENPLTTRSFHISGTQYMMKWKLFVKNCRLR